jgi:hypothetical protein
MALRFMYRISGGEVLVASTTQDFAERDATRFGVLTDPTLTDGADMAVKKIAIPGTNTVRNATAGEITTMATALAAELLADRRAAAKAVLDASTATGQILRAIIEGTVSQLNVIRADPQIALPDITYAQLRIFIQKKLDSGDVD